MVQREKRERPQTEVTPDPTANARRQPKPSPATKEEARPPRLRRPRSTAGPEQREVRESRVGRPLEPRKSREGKEAPEEHGLGDPWSYAEHLLQEHGLTVTPELGWPTNIKRWRLQDIEKGRVLRVYTGTEAEALDHFFAYLHPQIKAGGVRPGRLPHAA